MKYGACSSDVWGNDKDWRVKPSAEAYADGLKGNDTLKKYYRIKSLTEAKKALAHKHLPRIVIDYYASTWDSECYDTGIIRMPKKGEEPDGGHAMILVGYDDKKSRFIVRNSWGTNWGDKGYFYIEYKTLKYLWAQGDCWIITK